MKQGTGAPVILVQYTSGLEKNDLNEAADLKDTEVYFSGMRGLQKHFQPEDAYCQSLDTQLKI